MMLDGEVVVISGVGPGLGRRMAVRAAAEGASVVLGARSTEVTNAVVDEIEAAGGQAVAVACDVRRDEDVTRLADTAVERFGRITGLVNSAFSHPGFDDLLDTPARQFQRALDITLFGTLAVTRAVVPHMRAAGGGSIVNIGTMATRTPQRGEGAYATTKAAVHAATRYLALELGEHGIRVNQAVMGWLDGPSVRIYMQMKAAERGVEVQDLHDEVAARNPLGRIPTDEAGAGAVLFLLSPFASEVTGASLDINAGEYMPT